MSTLTFSITPEQDGRRLSRLLRTDCRCSARLVKQLKYLPDGILLDGARALLDSVCPAGQRLILRLPLIRRQISSPAKGLWIFFTRTNISWW